MADNWICGKVNGMCAWGTLHQNIMESASSCHLQVLCGHTHMYYLYKLNIIIIIIIINNYIYKLLSDFPSYKPTSFSLNQTRHAVDRKEVKKNTEDQRLK